MKKYFLVLALSLLIFNGLSVNAEIDDVFVTRSQGEVIDDDKIEVNFNALAVNFFGTEVDSDYEWDFDNDGNIDAKGKEATHQFDFENRGDIFSYGYQVQVIATEKANTNEQKEVNFLFKPTLSSTPMFILQRSSFGSLFSRSVDSLERLAFRLEYIVRLNSTGERSKVRLFNRVEKEYKPFVKIRKKVVDFGSSVETAEFVVNKVKLKAEFPELLFIEIPVHSYDARSGVGVRQLIHVDLEGTNSFVVNEGLVEIID